MADIGITRRTGHVVWHQYPQFDHDDFPFRTSRCGRRGVVGPRDRASRSFRKTAAGFDDRARRRTWIAADRYRQRRPRPRNRRPNGDRDPRWAGDLDRSQLAHTANAGAALRTIRPNCLNYLNALRAEEREEGSTLRLLTKNSETLHPHSADISASLRRWGLNDLPPRI